MIPSGPIYPWKKAGVLIALSTLFSLAFFALFRTPKDRPIEGVAQRAHTDSLATACLVELLDLSVDRPLSFARFPLEEATKRLQAHPIFGRVKVEKVRPNILYIDYALRTPIARLGSQSNAVIDEEGISFPFTPFFSPRSLPILFTKGEGHSLFLSLRAYDPEMVDLTAIDAPSLAKREVVVKMKNGALLRLTPQRLEEEMARYSLLEKKVDVAGKIIDLRIPNVAYIDG